MKNPRLYKSFAKQSIEVKQIELFYKRTQFSQIGFSLLKALSRYFYVERKKMVLIVYF